MSRTSGDEIKGDAVWNGYDYALQVWVTYGIVEPCGHPAAMGAECCNQRKYAGRGILGMPGREKRS